MAAKRKLWKVTTGIGETWRPESTAKVYSIYVPNARASFRAGTWPPVERERARRCTIWCDYRDGSGYQCYDVIDLAKSDQP